MIFPYDIANTSECKNFQKLINKIKVINNKIHLNGNETTSNHGSFYSPLLSRQKASLNDFQQYITIEHKLQDKDSKQYENIEEKVSCLNPSSFHDISVQTNHKPFLQLPSLQYSSNLLQSLQSSTNQLTSLQSPTNLISSLQSPTNQLTSLQSPTNQLRSLQSPTNQLTSLQSPTHQKVRRISQFRPIDIPLRLPLSDNEEYDKNTLLEAGKLLKLLFYFANSVNLLLYIREYERVYAG